MLTNSQLYNYHVLVKFFPSVILQLALNFIISFEEISRVNLRPASFIFKLKLIKDDIHSRDFTVFTHTIYL